MSQIKEQYNPMILFQHLKMSLFWIYLNILPIFRIPLMNSMAIFIPISNYKKRAKIICFCLIRAESLFYSIGAYLHELGHLFGLDHGNHRIETLMSSSKDYIDSGRDFFCTTSRLCSFVSNRQCLCYEVNIFRTQ